MIKLLCFLLALYYQQYMCNSNPLTGKNVRNATTDEFPFIVSITRNRSSYFRDEIHLHQCTGSLITKRHVLTAAHCFRHLDTFADAVVKFGSVDLKSTELYGIRSWITYKEWDEKNNERPKNGFYDWTYHDIAIVTLSKAVNCKIKVGIISKFSDANIYGKTATLAGWGEVENYQQPRYLQTATVKILHPNECYFNIDEIDPLSSETDVEKRLLCTKAEPYVRVECGDSGGPLMLHNKEIVGINRGSCTLEKGRDLSKYQNVHIAVDWYKQFIDHVITHTDQ